MVVTGQQVAGQGYPVELALTIGGSLEFVGDIYFSGTVPSYSLTLTIVQPNVVVTTLQQLLNANDDVNTVLGVQEVADLLGKPVGESPITIGAILIQIQILQQSNLAYQLGTLPRSRGKSPAQVAEALFADALAVLASDANPLVPIGGDGI